MWIVQVITSWTHFTYLLVPAAGCSKELFRVLSIMGLSVDAYLLSCSLSSVIADHRWSFGRFSSTTTLDCTNQLP